MPRAEGRRVKKMANHDEVGFYNPFDGLKGRDGGPYLDAENRRRAELQRALVEDRKPADPHGVLPADVGTPLVVAQLVQDNSAYSNPSMASRPGFDAVLTDERLAQEDFNPNIDQVGFADPVSILPVDHSDSVEESDLADEEGETEENVDDTAAPSPSDSVNVTNSTTTETNATANPFTTGNNE